MGLPSTVVSASDNSVRTTIPQGIAQFLKVEPGDKLDWEMETTDGTVTVRKVKEK